MVTYCNPIYGYADQIVGGGWYQFQGFAQNAYDLAIEKLEDLQDFVVPDVPLSLSYTFDTSVAEFTPPAAPTREIDEFVNPDAPADVSIDLPSLDLSQVPALPDAPELPVYSAPARPDISLPAAPDLSVELDDLVLPDAPSYTLPDAPTFYELNLPEVPDLTIPAYDIERPDFQDIDIDRAPFVFNEAPYDETMVDAIKAKVTVMLQGGTGLDADTEQALFDRARGRDDLQTNKAVDEVYNEYSARGFSIPNGVMFKNIDIARQEGQNRTAATSRDIYIQAQTVEIENLRFAVAQGIALEQVLISLHLAVQERAFQVLRYAREAYLQIINAEIARANLQAQIFQTDAQVYRDRIQAELAKVEVYRAEIEGQRAIGEINVQLVQRYEAQLRGVLAMVDVYKTQVEAVSVQAQLNTQRIEAKKAEADVFKSQVDAYEASWRGFTAQVEGELGNVRTGEIAAQTYLSRIQAVKTMNDVAVERQRNGIAIETLKLTKFDSLLRKYAAEIEAERAKVNASVQALQADAQVYSAAADVAQAQSATADRALQLNLERTRAETDIQLRRGEIAINTTLQRSAQLLEALKAAGTIAAQLSASSMSAVNLSASISSSQGNSTSCNVGYNLSGDI